MADAIISWRRAGSVREKTVFQPQGRADTEAAAGRSRLTPASPAIRKRRENNESEWQDLNLRPLRPERSALPG